MTPPSPSPADPSPPRDEAAAWFVRRRDAGWQAADETAFAAWLAADPAHTRRYQRYAAQWDELDAMPADRIQQIRQKLDVDLGRAGPAASRTPSSAAEPAPPSRRRFLTWPLGPALAATGLAAVGGLGLGLYRLSAPAPAWAQAFRTERGQHQRVTLPDGSELVLDTATQLEVAFHDDRREARLPEGQAAFSVQADTGRPFEVLAGPLRITVVGTRFSVRYTPGVPGQEGVTVSVEQGQVQVAPQADQRAGEATLLGPGQQIASNARGELQAVAPMAVQGPAAWQRQRVSFVDVPLSQALAEIERYRSTGLVIRDPAVAALRLSGTFDPRNPQALRLALSRVLPVRLRERRDVTEIQALRPETD